MMHLDRATPDDAPVIAAMLGELLIEIMTAIDEQVFRFDQDETAARARAWLAEDRYVAVLARTARAGAPLGFVGLSEGCALYAEGTVGTITELYVRPSWRSRGLGAALLSEARRIGQARGWRRLEVATPPLPQFDRALRFYQRHGFGLSGGRKLKIELE